MTYSYAAICPHANALSAVMPYNQCVLKLCSVQPCCCYVAMCCHSLAWTLGSLGAGLGSGALLGHSYIVAHDSALWGGLVGMLAPPVGILFSLG